MRRIPYSESGIARVRCGVVGCTQRGALQWRVRSCEVGGPDRWVAVCERCDAGINAFVRSVFALDDRAESAA